MDAPECAIYYCIVAAEIAVSGGWDGVGKSVQRSTGVGDGRRQNISASIVNGFAAFIKEYA
jgi:hypothetical protein